MFSQTPQGGIREGNDVHRGKLLGATGPGAWGIAAGLARRGLLTAAAGSALGAGLLARPNVARAQQRHPLAGKTVEMAVLGIRPEHVAVSSARLVEGVPAVVSARSVGIGGWLLLTLQLAGRQTIRAKVPPGRPWQPGDAVHAACAPGRAVLFQGGVRLRAVPTPQPAQAEA